MRCHICENGAIGMCRQCYKFYCPEHGDSFCQKCQQKGWATSTNIVIGGDAQVAMVAKKLDKVADATENEAKDKTLAEKELPEPAAVGAT